MPDLPLRPLEKMGLKELERIRLLLRGGSVVEWRQLHFRTRDEVDRFLKLWLLDTENPIDEFWMRTILADAVDYLRTNFKYRVAAAVANPKELHDLFLYASGAIASRYRKISCIVLKVMHVLQHVEARELRFQLAVSEADFARLATERVQAVVDLARAKGLQIVSFSDSIKSRASIVTKLLGKGSSTGAVLHDLIRFRITVREHDDLIPLIYFLTQRLLPFNGVVPEQTENTLIRFRDLVEKNPNFQRYAGQLHLDLDYEERTAHARNDYSGSTYRTLNFVAEIPIRLDQFLPPPDLDVRERRSRVGVATCEFQIFDVATQEENERGENAHYRYKERQRETVLKRLSRGLVIPRGNRKK